LGAGGSAAEDVEESHGDEAADKPSADGSGHEIPMVALSGRRRCLHLLVGMQWLVRSPHLEQPR